MIFFRPENVLIQDDSSLPLPEYLPHLAFPEALVKTCEFAGTHYRLSCLWEGHTIKVHTIRKPRGEIVQLGVRTSEVKEFLQGKRQVTQDRE
jgi:hypothetical protein